MRHTDMSLFVTNKFLTTYENWNRKEKFRTEWVEILSEWLHFLIFMLPLLKTHWQVWTLFTSFHKKNKNIKSWEPHYGWYLLWDPTRKGHWWALHVYKGQIKPKAVWARHGFSQKTNERICFISREKQKSKQNKFIRSFLGRIYGAPFCFRF